MASWNFPRSLLGPLSLGGWLVAFMAFRGAAGGVSRCLSVDSWARIFVVGWACIMALGFLDLLETDRTTAKYRWQEFLSRYCLSCRAVFSIVYCINLMFMHRRVSHRGILGCRYQLLAWTLPWWIQRIINVLTYLTRIDETCDPIITFAIWHE